jgi:hypothetical protein
MRTVRVLWTFVLLVWVADCTAASGVRALGADTYASEGRNPGGSAGLLIVQHAAYEQAQAFCEGRSLRLLPEAGQSSADIYALRFRCVAPGNPGSAKPLVDQAPDPVL